MRISLAQLQSAVDAAGFPAKSTLDTNPKLHEGVKSIELMPGGVLVKVVTKNGNVHGVPVVNFKYLKFAEDVE